MTFEEYLYSISNQKRLELFEMMKCYGEPNEILRELARIPPCVQNKDFDLRINQKYFLYHRNKRRFSPADTGVIAIKDIQYCYYGYEGCGFSNIGLIGYDGRHTECSVRDDQTGLIVFRKLRSYVKGLEDVKAYSGNDTIPEIRVLERWDGIYVLKNNAIYYQRRALFGGTKEKTQVHNINDIIWCVQHYDCDDGVTSYSLELCLLNKGNNCTLYFKSGETAFLFALELKKRVPHLLYGYNPEYEALYQRNPAALLQIAKNQTHK